MSTTTFQQLYSRLMGDVPGISLNRAQQTVQDAWRDFNESRLWSFNLAETELIAPALTSAGTVTVTRYSTSVVANAAATTAWQAIPVQTPITVQQFRVSGGLIYNIIAYDGASTITLDRPFSGTTGAGTAYQIYRIYYSVSAPQVPVAPGPFLCWEQIFDPINIYPFDDVAMSKATLDRIDPGRMSFSNPIYMAAYKNDSTGNLQYEMWPHQQAYNPYQCLYRHTGTDLVNDSDALPLTVSREMIANYATVKACEWAELNKGRIEGGSKIDFLRIQKQANERYLEMLDRFSVQDDERILSYYIKYRGGNAAPGLHTGSYLQSHDGAGILYPNL